MGRKQEGRGEELPLRFLTTANCSLLFSKREGLDEQIVSFELRSTEALGQIYFYNYGISIKTSDMLMVKGRGAVEIRLLRDRNETRQDFEVSRSRQDTRLYISCFGLSQGCKVRVGSRSRMLLAKV